MNEACIARWLEQKRRTDQTSAAVISALALGSGGIVFLLAALLIHTVLSIICGTLGHSVPGIWLAALGRTAGIFTSKGSYVEGVGPRIVALWS